MYSEQHQSSNHDHRLAFNKVGKEDEGMEGIENVSDAEMDAQESGSESLDKPQSNKASFGSYYRDQEMFETGSEDWAYPAASDSEGQDDDGEVAEESDNHEG